MTTRPNTAVCTTVYAGVERFLADWYASLVAQTDQDFDLWIATDTLSPSVVQYAMGATFPAIWVESQAGDTPAAIRQRAFARLVDDYENIIFVDSDDLLLPDRIRLARQQLQHADLAGCAMRIIEEHGRDTGLVFAGPTTETSDDWLLYRNAFGLSNTAYRSATLRQCLPIPHDCVLVDWCLATRAWLCGARLHFGGDYGMAYRQYGNNTARVVPPFSAEDVLRATQLVLNHYACLLRTLNQLVPARVAAIVTARAYVAAFQWAIMLSQGVLQRYVTALNNLPPRHLWWSCVAHPQLEGTWKN